MDFLDSGTGRQPFSGINGLGAQLKKHLEHILTV